VEQVIKGKIETLCVVYDVVTKIDSLKIEKLGILASLRRTVWGGRTATVKKKLRTKHDKSTFDYRKRTVGVFTAKPNRHLSQLTFSHDLTNRAVAFP
jgi:hypothetical protein